MLTVTKQDKADIRFRISPNNMYLPNYTDLLMASKLA
jgi:hypothetical protein